MKRSEHMAGMLRVLLLVYLANQEGYGYGMAEAFRKSGLTVRPESLYPVLGRLEEEGLLQQRWVEADNGRPRKVYTATAAGKKAAVSTRTEFIDNAKAALKFLDTPMPATTAESGKRLKAA